MNRMLIEALVDLAAFLYINIDDDDESTRIDGRAALKALDYLSYQLSELTLEERLEFADFVSDMAARAEERERQSAPFVTPAHEVYMEFLQSFVDDLRDNEDEEDEEQQD